MTAGDIHGLMSAMHQKAAPSIRLFAAAGVLAGVLAGACSAVPGDIPLDVSLVPSQQPGGTAAPGGGGDGGPVGQASTAVVTVGSERYEFDNMTCYPGVLLGATSGDELPRVSFTIPPTDWETSGQGFGPPNVSLQLAETPDGFVEAWTADPQATEGLGQVDSYTRTNSSASGTATFVETTVGNFDEPVAVQGTFELTC